jgi:hypothetical protein
VPAATEHTTRGEAKTRTIAKLCTFTPTRTTRAAVLEVQAEISTVWLIFSIAAAAHPRLQIVHQVTVYFG